MPDYQDEMVDYVCGCHFEDLPSFVIQRAREVLADTLSVIAAGAQEDEVKALITRITLSCGKQVATVVGGGIRTEPSKAALINGAAGTSLELDEGNQFARGHPAIHVIPAALAVAEEMSLSGRELLTALVLGYEVGARIGIASKLRKSMHPHGTWGTVGAAVAVGKLMGYDSATMRELINVSSSLGLATSRRTMLEGGTVRNVYSGVSGMMGVLAHSLVESGFTGEKDGLKTVFGTVVSEDFVTEALTQELGHRFEITRNYFKRHACCRYNHATLDALHTIVSKLPGGLLQPERVTKVEVLTYSLAAQLCDPDPHNTLGAKFSIPFAVATFIVHGHAGVSSFTPQAVNDPVIKGLAQKVVVSEDSGFTGMMPERRPSRVRVVLSDGRILEAESLINKGDFEDPYNWEEMQGKYFELTDPVWGHGVAERIYSQVMTLEKLKNVNEMTALIAPLA